DRARCAPLHGGAPGKARRRLPRRGAGKDPARSPPGRIGPRRGSAPHAVLRKRRLDAALPRPLLRISAVDRRSRDRRGAPARGGAEKPVRTIASNMGHLLWSQAIPRERARRIARVLLSPEGFNGWGIRTLSRGQTAYNPLSYHNGTVWPHDNSLIAMGLSHYGLQRQVLQILTGAYDAARSFRHYRLPELFCGMS